MKNVSSMVILGIVTLFMAACSPAATPEPVAALTEVDAALLVDFDDPFTLSGDIYAAGSSTVGPLSEAIAEQFITDGFNGTIKNDIIGSGAGFERFCKAGETDISNASRKIKDSEVENCAALIPQRTPLGFNIAIDAIAVVVSKQNTFATDVTMEELGLLFTTAEKWSDVRADWPAEPIQRFTPGTDSGTFEYFTEAVIQKPNKLEKLDMAEELVLNASKLQLSEDDNVLVTGVEGSQYAIGYFGVAYYDREQDKLNALSIGGFDPRYENAISGDYPLARPLFIYSDAEIMNAKPQVAGFIKYYLEYVNDVVGDVGYYPASDEDLEASKALWLEAMGLQDW